MCRLKTQNWLKLQFLATAKSFPIANDSDQTTNIPRPTCSNPRLGNTLIKQLSSRTTAGQMGPLLPLRGCINFDIETFLMMNTEYLPSDIESNFSL